MTLKTLTKSTFAYWPLLASVALVSTSMAAAAASPDGTWLRPKTGAHIKVGPCGGGLGMKVTKSKTAANVGKTIMCGAKPNGPGKWTGDITSTEDGNTYSGYVTLEGSALKLQGCVLGGVICKTETWTRVK